MKDFFAPERSVTDRFILRAYQAGDGVAMSDAVASSYAHLKTFMSWAVEQQPVTEAETLARQFQAHYLTQKDFVLGIFALDERTLLGGCGFHLREGPLGGRSAEIGMWIRASHAGQGLGSAVLAELCRWGFTDWPWLRLVWKCDTLNAASCRLAEKSGFTREGVLRQAYDDVSGGRRDTAIYGLLRSEWLGD